MKAAIFVRVSTKNQDYNRQISDLKKEAEKQGIQIVATITEIVSGAKQHSKRQGIQKLLHLAEQGKIQKVLTTEVSRLGRTTLENLQLLEQLHGYKASLYAQDLGFDTLVNGKPSMLGEILFTVLSSLARQEREKLIERVKSGLEEAKKQGKQLGRPPGEKEVTQTKGYDKIMRLLNQGHSIRNVAKIAGVSARTVQKVKNSLIRESIAKN